jgi:hypothetical protein
MYEVYNGHQSEGGSGKEMIKREKKKEQTQNRRNYTE